MPEAISRRPSPSGAVTRMVPRGWPDSALTAASASVDGVQHLLGAGIEHGAVLGRHQLPGRAVEQPHAEMLLQFLDAVGGDGRRNPHVAAGGRQIAEFDHPHEDGDIVEIGHG